jgi:hypothetical protein
MAFSSEETVAELAALRVAIRMLLDAANLQSAESGLFARNALKVGLAEFADIDRWEVPDGEKAKFRILAEASYRDLFSGL